MMAESAVERCPECHELFQGYVRSEDLNKIIYKCPNDCKDEQNQVYVASEGTSSNHESFVPHNYDAHLDLKRHAPYQYRSSYRSDRLSDGRIDGHTVIRSLCQFFRLEQLEKKIVNLFNQVTGSRKLRAAACAAFLIISEQAVNAGNLDNEPAPSEALRIANEGMKDAKDFIKASDITYCWKKVLKLNGPTQDVDLMKKQARPLEFYSKKVEKTLPLCGEAGLFVEPFYGKADISLRMTDLTTRILQLYDRRVPDDQFDTPKYFIMAANYLSWESFFYMQLATKDLRDEQQKERESFRVFKMPRVGTLPYFLDKTGHEVNDVVVELVQDKYNKIVDAFALLVKEMTWLDDVKQPTKKVPEHLHMILLTQDCLIERLHERAVAKSQETTESEKTPSEENPGQSSSE